MVGNNGDNVNKKNTRSETTVYSSGEDDDDHYSSASDGDLNGAASNSGDTIWDYITSLAEAMRKDRM